MYHIIYISFINIVSIYIYIIYRSMIDPFGSRAFDRGNTDVLSQSLGGGDAEKELLLIRQALVEFFFSGGM
jgi:hypothetical protein